MSPLSPILMTPYFRHGAATPWGGDRLKALYHKNIPDDRTGESLEVSALPGMESVSPDGAGLSSLIAEYGERLTGTAIKGEFPLLLKLLDAREKLSVQVHPSDIYARRVEGKFGKTEAWVILAADENAQLVFGVKENVTREQLKEASDSAQIESLLRFLPVKAGDTLYIAAGTVHAIGGGIVLYEIQQSSDVTYRLYDWERRNDKGEKRELHIDKALDVVTLSGEPQKATPERLAPGVERLIEAQYFTLDRLTKPVGVDRDERRFKLLTAIEESFLTWQGGSLRLPAGATALLPADGYDLSLFTAGALLAFPTV